MYKDVKLTEEEENAVQSYWKTHYGRKISTRWHRLYQSYNGNFNEAYFPEILYTTRLERKLNNRKIGRVVSDKSFFPMYYRDVKNVRLPDTYIMNNSSVFYTADRKILSKENAVKRIENIGAVAIKPTLDSSSGESVILCDFKDGIDVKSGKSCFDIITSYNENFLVQERIIPCEQLKALYPNAINTFRVITYLVEDKVMHAPVTLSMGRAGNHVDNIQAGGISIAVSDEGELNKVGHTHFNEVHLSHPDTGTVFMNHKIPKVKEIIEVTKEMKEKTPHVNIVSWDITIDKNEDIVLLEFNIFGQSVCFLKWSAGKQFSVNIHLI